jgi:hypothetical protein
VRSQYISVRHGCRWMPPAQLIMVFFIQPAAAGFTRHTMGYGPCFIA